MGIMKYSNNILTHVGQTTVAGFGAEIAKASTEIKAIKPLEVIVGYHGTDPKGDHDRDFDAAEDQQTKVLAHSFPDANLVWVRDPGMTDAEIIAACKKGSVFFTWCDSDNKVKSVYPALGTGTLIP